MTNASYLLTIYYNVFQGRLGKIIGRMISPKKRVEKPKNKNK